MIRPKQIGCALSGEILPRGIVAQHIDCRQHKDANRGEPLLTVENQPLGIRLRYQDHGTHVVMRRFVVVSIHQIFPKILPLFLFPRIIALKRRNTIQLAVRHQIGEIDRVIAEQKPRSHLTSQIASHTAVPTCSVVAGGPFGLKSAVTRPAFNTASIAPLTAAASSFNPKLYSNIAATDPMAPSGFALFFPAISGADPCTGSYNPTHAPLGFFAPIEAEGSIPIEPASTAPSSLRISPNMFSVRITSNRLGFSTSCIAQLSTNK